MADSDRIIAADPGNAAARNNKADILLSLRRFDEASALFDAVIAMTPNDPAFYFNRRSPARPWRPPPMRFHG